MTFSKSVIPRGGDGERKSKDYWTVLILGRDTGGGGNTDTMLLASYDVTNQKATVMSIPRDTMVNPLSPEFPSSSVPSPQPARATAAPKHNTVYNNLIFFIIPYLILPASSRRKRRLRCWRL